MKKTNLRWVMALLLGVTTVAVQAEDKGHGEEAQPSRSGAEVAKACVSCHGEKGISQADMYPHLAGQHAGYLEQALHDYKSGRRKNQIMNAMAANLSDADIEAVAEYFASQEGLVTPPREPSAN